MQPKISSRPLPKTVPQNGKDRGGFYQYRGEKKFPQPGEKPKGKRA